jgi:hypothetical protein
MSRSNFFVILCDLMVKIFHKKNKVNELPVKENRRIVTTDYLQVIEASEIVEMEAPPFNQAQWKDESDYKSYLESVQPLIEEYERTGSIHNLEYNSFNDIERNRDEQHNLKHFRDSFMDAGQWISVEKSIDGKYRVVSNGRHRMYVAKKYGLKLLVHVSQEVIENDNL